MKFFTSTLFLISCLSLLGQTGPAGVGSSSNNIIWLDASSMGLTNNDPLSSWTDLSGNGNNADMATSTFRPTFKTAQLNGKATVDFDGTDDRLVFGSNVTNSAHTIFVVANSAVTSYGSILALQNYHLSFLNKYMRVEYSDGNKTILKNEGSFSVYSSGTGPSLASGTISLTNNTSSKSLSRTSPFLSLPESSIGAFIFNGNYRSFFNGQLAEIIVYNDNLDTVKRGIILSSLAAKYNLTSPSTLYQYKTSYNNNVKGIGQEANGSNVTARGNDSLLISNASSLGNGDYLLVGHDNGGYSVSNSVPSGITERWTQVWRADVTGTPGTISVEFFLGANGFSSPTNYAVIVEQADGDFSNGGTTIHQVGRSYNAGSNSITFTGLTLADGNYFTLAELDGEITSDRDGDWNTTSTWSCACVPGQNDIVTIENTHDVTINANSAVLNLTIDAGGSLSFLGSDTLEVYDTLNLSGSLTAGSGTISAKKLALNQLFTNSTGNPVNLNNLIVENASGLTLNTGGWIINNSVRVTTGGLIATSADSVVIKSDASSTAQILEGMNNAFTGNFTIQRFISSRNANFANFSSPMVSATIGDLDDDLYISGVGGADGDALTTNGSVFRSVYEYDKDTDAHAAVTSIATTMTSGKGFEIYLASNLTTFNGGTVDYVGVPFSGPLSSTIQVNNGWNFLGNPYQSFIGWDNVERTNTSATRGLLYIFDSNSGSYTLSNFGDGTSIAPSQGFWVYSVGGNVFINFAEEDKVSSTSSAFLRRKNNPALFQLKLSSNNNQFKSQVNIVLEGNASQYIDELDGPFLSSPIEQAPSIFARTNADKQKLAQISLNPTSTTQNIQITVESPEEGEYKIDSKDLEDVFQYYSCAYLVNQNSNEVVDLFANKDYRFKAESGQESNFNLILSNSYEDCQMEIKSDIHQKIDNSISLRQSSFNQWYVDFVIRDSKTRSFEIRIYNLNGQLISEAQIFSANQSGTKALNFNGIKQGVYLIQVKSNDQILNKTIKL